MSFLLLTNVFDYDLYEENIDSTMYIINVRSERKRKNRGEGVARVLRAHVGRAEKEEVEEGVNVLK